MKLYENNLYKKDVAYIANLPLNWEKIKNKKIMISGASGMIGSFFIDVIMYRNERYGDNCSVIALGRNIEKAKERFSKYWSIDTFKFISHDINTPLNGVDGKVNFILHAASNTHPVAYATDPIGTVTTNVIGTYNLLNFAVSHDAERFLFTSSVEVYGENRGDTENFEEKYCGYIDCNTLRAGYPESKRVGEALCQAFIKQNNLDVVIPRLSRTYGPTMLKSDTKAISQFIKLGVINENIILKSKGNQYYSYNYVADTVSAILIILFNGKCGEAYNVADGNSDITLRDLAKMIADFVGKEVIFQIPDSVEMAGYSKATKAVMNSDKLRDIGWKPAFNIKKGIEHTLSILKKENE